jgi:hypothetical protein
MVCAAGEWADVLGLDSDDPHLGLERLQSDCDSGGQPAAADRNHERPEVLQLLDQLQGDRPLPGDHTLVLERVHERCASRFDSLLRSRHRLVEARADELDRARHRFESRPPSPSASPEA